MGVGVAVGEMGRESARVDVVEKRAQMIIMRREVMVSRLVSEELRVSEQVSW